MFIVLKNFSKGLFLINILASDIYNNNKKVNIFISNERAKILYQHLILNTARVSTAYKKKTAYKEPEKDQNKAQPVIVTDQY